MRAVLDVNVLIAALLSPRGRPAQLVRRWLSGDVELIVSPLLLEELRRALGYPKLVARIAPEEADAFVALLHASALLIEDPEEAPPVRSADPADDYVIALAAASRSVIVSGDRHLTELKTTIPVCTPAEALALLDDQS